MTTEIINTQNTIDSSDVIARIEELEPDKIELEDAMDDADGRDNKEEAEVKLYDWHDSDDGQEYKALSDLQSEAEGTPDWQHGTQLIHESYFTEYAQQTAEDCGMVPNANDWPNNHIDWDAAADALKVDYFEVDFDGHTYYVRA